MKLSLTTQVAIKEHALNSYPNECCGVIKNDIYVPCENKHKQPKNNFKIDHEIIAQSGIDAIVHSHTNGRNWPSEIDLRSQAQIGLPWVIVCCDSGGCTDLFIFGDGYIQPLIGRPFRFGVTDCYTLIRDYYKEILGLKFSPFFYEGSKNCADYADLYTRHLYEYGFKKKSVLKNHDILTFSVNNVDCHAGVYLGDGIFMHHLEGQLSRKDSLQNWMNNLTGIFHYNAS